MLIYIKGSVVNSAFLYVKIDYSGVLGNFRLYSQVLATMLSWCSSSNNYILRTHRSQELSWARAVQKFLCSDGMGQVCKMLSSPQGMNSDLNYIQTSIDLFSCVYSNGKVLLQSEQVTRRTHQGEVSCEEFKHQSIGNHVRIRMVQLFTTIWSSSSGDVILVNPTRGTLGGFKDHTNRRVLGMQTRFYTSIVGDCIEW